MPSFFVVFIHIYLAFITSFTVAFTAAGFMVALELCVSCSRDSLSTIYC